MAKQRRKQRSISFGSMSFVERAGLLFGVVGLFADGAFLFTFATGVSNIREYIPSSVPTPSALLFFALTSGLIIIYGWFALSWYLVRRTFVLLGQMPIRFHRPLVRRSSQTVAGIGIIIIPLAIAWSLVNLPNDIIKEAGLTATGRFVTVTPDTSSSLTQAVTNDPAVIETPMRIVVPIPESEKIASGWTQYFMFCFPILFLFFGFVVWLPINLLMPIVHVELLLDGIDDDVIDALSEYLNNS